VSEQGAEPTSGEPGFPEAERAAGHADSASGAAPASTQQTVQASARGDYPMPWEDDANPLEGLQSYASKRATLRKSAEADGKIVHPLTGNRAWETPGAEQEPETGAGSDGMFGKQRLAALAATVALALVAGAVGGGLLATSDRAHVAGSDSAASGNRALEAAVARIDADLLAVKASVENTSRLGLMQFSQTSERLDKLEKVQAEPAAKLGRLSEALEMLRDAPPPVVSPPIETARVISKDITGSIPAPVTLSTKTTLVRPPVVQGWLLRKIANGVASIESRDGLFEVRVGDSVPGVGDVDAIRRQDGRWAVVTSKGLIVGH
jgi:hypothetical protein